MTIFNSKIKYILQYLRLGNFVLNIIQIKRLKVRVRIFPLQWKVLQKVFHYFYARLLVCLLNERYLVYNGGSGLKKIQSFESLSGFIFC